MEIQEINVNKLKKHPDNYRQHNDVQQDHLINSLQRYGFYKNIIISKDNYILAGHGIYEAAKKLKKKKIPVVIVPYNHDDPESIAILVGDNEILYRAITDDIKLFELLKKIEKDNDKLLLGTGYDKQMIMALEKLSAPQFKELYNDIIVEFNEGLNYKDRIADYRLIIRFLSNKKKKEFIDKYLSEYKQDIFKRSNEVWNLTIK